MSDGAKPRPAAPRRRPGPFVPFARFEDVVVRCGHVEKFGLLPEGQDRFREGRRQKLLSRDCKTCREQKQKIETEAAEKRKAEKELRKAQRPSPDKPAGPRGGRLPDGSKFEVVFDAAKQQWAGTLTVPGAASAFTGSASGLFPLLTLLDGQYRETVAASEPETA